MDSFFSKWHEAALTSAGFFWMALWAFVFGYLISSIIQVFITQDKMKKSMGKDDAKSILLGSFFGFLSSSCSFSALATTKSLFKKGAGFISSLAFLLASTNLVIELGFVIAIFLGWQFVVGEYVGGVLLILITYLLIRLIKPKKLIENARKNLGEEEQMDHHHKKSSLKERLKDLNNWKMVGHQFIMEWKMVWKDVTVGFAIAGIVAAFVPDTFFETLFINTDVPENSQGFLTVLEHSVVGPVAAFFTFIGSMGNIPLAALLFGKGVSFAGVMAFIFSDLVVFPVLRINAKYYGWKMSLFILFLLFTGLVTTSILLHYGFSFFDAIPTESANNIMEQNHFKFDTGFVLNIVFLIIAGVLVYLGLKSQHKHKHEMASKGKVLETILKYLSFLAYGWLIVGLFL